MWITRGPYIHTRRNLVTNTLEDFNITNLCPFEYDPLIVDPRQVANIDQEIVHTDEITSHTGNPKRRAYMTFLIRWGGVMVMKHGHHGAMSDILRYTTSIWKPIA